MIRGAVILFLLCTAAPAIAQEPWEWVEQGIEHFDAGRYTHAGEAFATAAVAAPENPVAMYDQGCSLLAEGRLEDAREALLSAASSREADVAGSARYNLGLVESALVREMLGDDPGGVKGDDRTAVLDGLAAAARRFRACLDLEPENENARYNLELVRLYAKQLQDLWKQRDEEEKEEEPPEEEENALQMIVRVMNAQEDLRDRSDRFEDEPPGEGYAEALDAASVEQQELATEMPALQEKLDALMSPHDDPNAPVPSDEQQQQIDQAKEAVRGLVNAAEESMTASSDALGSADPRAAKGLQARATDTLEPVFRGIANFEGLVQEAVKLQQALVESSEGRATAIEMGETLTELELVPEAPRLSGRQTHVQGWSELLAPHAEQRLAQLEQAPPAGAAPGQPVPPGQPGQPAPDPQAQAKAEAQQEQLKQAFEKALENGPEIARLTGEAAPLVGSEEYAAALPLQEEALRLLIEIAELLPQDDNQDQGGDQNEDEDQQENEDQQQDQDGNQEEDDPQSEQEQPQPQDLTRDEAERLLQRARDREQDYKRKQEELKGLLGTAPVQKDW